LSGVLAGDATRGEVAAVRARSGVDVAERAGMSPESASQWWDDAHMASEVDAAQESVVLASFANRHAAEHMLASLGREFRKKARK
jgi:hypothetical protein